MYAFDQDWPALCGIGDAEDGVMMKGQLPLSLFLCLIGYYIMVKYMCVGLKITIYDLYGDLVFAAMSDIV